MRYSGTPHKLEQHDKTLSRSVSLNHLNHLPNALLVGGAAVILSAFTAARSRARYRRLGPPNRPGGSYHSNRASSVFGTLTSSSQDAYTQLLSNRAAHPVMITGDAAASTAAAAAGSTTPAEKLGGYARLLRGEWSLDAASALDRLVPKLGRDKYKGQVRGSYPRYSYRRIK